jgi:formylglycine-generating enzyme required for sulfatase activity
VSLRASGQPLAMVLAEIERATGNRVRVVDDFGNDDKEILARPVALNFKGKPFWEVVDAVSAAAGVQFESLKEGTLLLSTEGNDFDKLEPTGEPVVVGLFLVRPCLESFHNRPKLAVRYEPRIGRPQLLGYHAQITLPGGDQVRYEPRSLFDVQGMFTGEFTLGLDPEVPQGTNRAERVDLEARFAVAVDWRPFTSPPLGTVSPKPVRMGKGEFVITRAEMTKEPPSHEEEFVVELYREGLSLDSVKVVLVDGTGRRVQPTDSGGSSGDEGSYTWRFDPSAIGGDPRKCRLVFTMSDGNEQTVGPLEKVAADTVAAGAAKLRVTKMGLVKQPMGGQQFEVQIEADGFPLPLEQAVVLGGRGMPMKPAGWSSSGDSYGFQFDLSQLPRDPTSCRLRLPAPTKIAEFVLRASFDDLPLNKTGLAAGPSVEAPTPRAKTSAETPALDTSTETAAGRPRGPGDADMPKLLTNSIGMKLVLIPAGEFQMGSPESEEGRRDNEGPQHRVEITAPFYIGACEVSQEEYEQVMGMHRNAFCKTGHRAKRVAGQDTGRFPVEMVSWNDAVEFCMKLSALPAERKASRMYRLPTEAEWEYACRAGTPWRFHYGDWPDDEYGNYGEDRTTAVGSFKPNPWGLYDVHGNVSEWCADCYSEDYYERSPSADPTGPASGSERVYRGGHFGGDPMLRRSAFRTGFGPDRWSEAVGFRVVCVH